MAYWTCPKCFGEGKRLDRCGSWLPWRWRWKPCEACGGTGRACPSSNPLTRAPLDWTRLQPPRGGTAIERE